MSEKHCFMNDGATKYSAIRVKGTASSLRANLVFVPLGKAHYIALGILFILVILFLPGRMVEAMDRGRKLLARLTGRKVALA